MGCGSYCSGMCRAKDSAGWKQILREQAEAAIAAKLAKSANLKKARQARWSSK